MEDDDLNLEEEMDFGSESDVTYVFYSKTDQAWMYSMQRPEGVEDVDFEVFVDVDAAYNAVQKRNFGK